MPRVSRTDLGMTTWNFGDTFTCSIVRTIDHEKRNTNLARFPVDTGIVRILRDGDGTDCYGFSTMSRWM